MLDAIYQRAALCRAFEEETARRVKSGDIKFPVYLSTGQEYIACTVAAWVDRHQMPDRQVFIQHRGHSTYLAFGGDLDALILELLGDKRGCAGGMGGSASIHSRPANIYGHDGMMGSQGPIAVGMCYANRKPTIVFIGDAAAEEDYFLAALGWAATKQLPILFVVEDNGLAVLTEKRVRRSWEVVNVAYGFGLTVRGTADDPQCLYESLPPPQEWPALINVSTKRIVWHAGAGIDDPDAFDRHAEMGKHIALTRTDEYMKGVNLIAKNTVSDAWTRLCAK